ncbi:hypothetical protein B0T10DRAFT_237098 [Thelonectria olida]|uniref:Uncharacterized protein n=1 Tax=Thelonectria olida TaxID=1576542 RepID=A0A9P9ASN3_9HYPO|nr:hypothetical protein B0T10DRAFT_237098 [Thelonectria olida]
MPRDSKSSGRILLASFCHPNFAAAAAAATPTGSQAKGGTASSIQFMNRLPVEALATNTASCLVAISSLQHEMGEDAQRPHAAQHPIIHPFLLPTRPDRVCFSHTLTHTHLPSLLPTAISLAQPFPGFPSPTRSQELSF